MELTNIVCGLKHEVSEEVTEEKTASAVGSGTLPVYATPALSALMENAAATLVEELLPEGWTTVGGSIALLHKAPTPVGRKVRAVAEVTAVEGRKISYKLLAFDESGEIGEASHERFAVQKDKFMDKALKR